MKLVLIYNMNNSKREQIEKFCSQLHIVVKEVATKDYLLSLNALVGLKKDQLFFPYTGFPFPEEMMIFHGFKSKEIESFIDLYNAAGLEKVNLKAQTTPNNLTWNSLQLHDELVKEHKQFYK